MSWKAVESVDKAIVVLSDRVKDAVPLYGGADLAVTTELVGQLGDLVETRSRLAVMYDKPEEEEPDDG